ncbi:MAG: DUF2911 domain-containing protein [Acidobacteriota bacterium]
MGSRTNKHIFAGIFAFVLAAAVFALGHGNDHGQTSAKVGNGTVSVEYHSPLAKGRDLLSMIKPGSYWRMGADSATTLTTDVELQLGDTAVPKGEYVLWAHFTDSENWSLVLATAPSRRQPDPATILVELPGSVSTLSDVVEALTIEVTGNGSDATLTLEWGTARLTADFTAV